MFTLAHNVHHGTAASPFACNDLAKTVDGSFIVSWRFDFDQAAQQLHNLTLATADPGMQFFYWWHCAAYPNNSALDSAMCAANPRSFSR